MHATLNTFDAALTAALGRWEVSIDPGRLGRLGTHFRAVVEANRRMNLTRITDPVEAAVRHYADSAAVLTWIRRRRITIRAVLDVGTGAGFPAVPLAVMRPDWSVTAIDATRKKIDFLRQTAAAMGLSNLRCAHAHSRHWKPSATGGLGPDPSCVELVVFRALTVLPKALRQAAGYVAPGGWLVAYKSASVDRSEQRAADAVAPRMQLRLCERYPYDLVLGDRRLERVLYVYRKSSPRDQRGSPETVA